MYEEEKLTFAQYETLLTDFHTMRVLSIEVYKDIVKFLGLQEGHYFLTASHFGLPRLMVSGQDHPISFVFEPEANNIKLVYGNLIFTIPIDDCYTGIIKKIISVLGYIDVSVKKDLNTNTTTTVWGQ